MQTIKGFVTISQFINNTPGVISPFGELSTWSLTYSKEKGEYQDNSLPGYKLHTFHHIDENGVRQIAKPEQVALYLNVVKSCLVYANGHIRPYNPQDFKNTINNDYFGTIVDLDIGEFVDNGQVALPSWISFLDTAENTFVKLWLSDASFAEQYDEYEITIIPPLSNKEDFFAMYGTAIDKINSRTISMMSDLIEIAKANHPETYLRMMSFDFVNHLVPMQKTATTWAILIYGKAGDNIDTIKDKIVEFLMLNSTHTRLQWEILLPDIFKRTEFVILPRWDKVSIPNLSTASNLYSSIFEPVGALNFAKFNNSFYPALHIDTHTVCLPYDYKAITLLATAGTTNIPDVDMLYKIFPDYIPVSTMTPDFARMSMKTQNWVILLGELLISAETATKFSTIPTRFRKIEREGKLFISAVYDDVNYLVAAKTNSFYSV